MSSSTISFALLRSDVPQFSPRVGSLTILRSEGPSINISTPSLITATSRGVVQHLSRDHARFTSAIRWTHVPFESFLQQLPPIPTLQTGPHPLHTFLGFRSHQHLLSISPRDPSDERDMPPNANDYISTYCARGVRKLSPSMWKSYIMACQPDLATPLSDMPFAKTPHSQKRLMKSVDRSIAWLTDLLKSPPNDEASKNSQYSPNVLVNLIGGADLRARTAFSNGLVEVLHGKEQEDISPLKSLDEGVFGYSLELPAIHSSMHAIASIGRGGLEPERPNSSALIPELIKASLTPLPPSKLRVAYSSASPHEVLRLIRDVGFDGFDARWAHHAADIGVSLDFCFPVREDIKTTEGGSAPSTETKMDLGINLFDPKYANDHTRLASNFRSASEQTLSDIPVCHCAACSPNPPPTTLKYSALEHGLKEDNDTLPPPYTKAYIHHLLHTHEMSSHALLAMHNLTVVDAFFAGIRAILQNPSTAVNFTREVDRFIQAYDENMVIFRKAQAVRDQVELERGKGRLAREREQQLQ